MSMSSDQATEAAVFLTLYKEAIETVKESAVRDTANESIQNFTERIINISKNRAFKKICDTSDNQWKNQGDQRLKDLVIDVRAFQFSHYMFLKYLPQFLTFQGDHHQLLQYIKTQNSLLEKDILD